jgi:hypothetical protein
MEENEEVEIVYNGTTFEIVPVKNPKFKPDPHTFMYYDDEDSNPWGEFWYDEDVFKKPEKKDKCNHEWKATQLLFNTVYDCVKCGVKKEENK